MTNLAQLCLDSANRAHYLARYTADPVARSYWLASAAIWMTLFQRCVMETGGIT